MSKYINCVLANILNSRYYMFVTPENMLLFNKLLHYSYYCGIIVDDIIVVELLLLVDFL